MNLAEYNDFCRSLQATSHVVQWGGAHVWKVGAKVFAIGRDDTGEALSVSFKCSPMSFEMLKDAPGLRPAPYLASRGMSWIQRVTDESMPDDDFRDYLSESHRLVGLKLTKRVRAELGLSR